MLPKVKLKKGKDKHTSNNEERNLKNTFIKQVMLLKLLINATSENIK